MTQRDPNTLYVLLAALFVGALVTANLVSSKVIVIGGLFVPAGVLAYSITFAVTDTICEIWGRRATQAVVNAGFLVQLIVWGLVQLAIVFPAAPFWDNQGAYADVLGSASRIILASMAAYLVSQTLDVFEFDWLKRRLGGRHLWLRNNGSTLVSQTVDTTIFVTLAFYGEAPVLPLIAGQLVIKYIIALLDTPVVYGLVYLVRWRLRTAEAAA